MQSFQVAFQVSADVVHEILDRAGLRRGARLEGVSVVKSMFDEVFRAARDELHALVDVREPAAWVRIAIEQLALWTIAYRGTDPTEIPREFAPAARYGWRYVADVAVRRAAQPPHIYLGTPSHIEISRAFTLLLIMGMVTEQSNWLHYFPERFSSAALRNDDPLSAIMLRLSDPEKERLAATQTYLQRKADPVISGHLEHKPFHSPYREWLEAALEEGQGIKFSGLKDVLQALITISGGRSLVQIHSLRYLVAWISDLVGLPRSAVLHVLEFLLLRSSRVVGTTRDYLRRHDGARMLYFSGAILPKPNHLDVLYASDVSEEILADTDHVILSPALMAEAIDFTEFLLYGSRPDLKQLAWLRGALDRVEHHYRRNVFERAVADVYREAGWRVVRNVERLGGALLDCGEIDAIALNSSSGALHVVEAKAVAAVTHSRAIAQAERDYFIHKQYHQRFLGKLGLIRAQFEKVMSELFPGDSHEPPVNISGTVVSRFPHPAALLVHEYRFVVFDDLVRSLGGQKTAHAV